MKAIITTTKNNVRLFLTDAGLASDRPERARTARDLTDAAIIAANVNAERVWSQFGIEWRAAYMLHNGEIAEP